MLSRIQCSCMPMAYPWRGVTNFHYATNLIVKRWGQIMLEKTAETIVMTSEKCINAGIRLFSRIHLET